MAVYALGDLEPDIAPDAWVHPDAVVIGRVRLGAGVSVWPTAVLRGDYGRIEVGAMSNIQDGTIIHCTMIHPTVIGARCVVGHKAHIEGATIGDDVLVASGSVVLNGATVRSGAIVGAGAVVPFDFEVPARRMALGVPARIRDGYEVPTGHTEVNTAMYFENSKYYRDNLRRVDWADDR